MSKILVVFGATGNQGGGVVNCILKDAELSKQYKIRAVSRDPSSSASQTLKQAGAEVVKGDIENAESVQSALKDAHAVFLATYSVYDDQLRARELRQGKSIADAAVAAGAKHFIYSTLDNTQAFHNGKLEHMAHFDGKNDVEQYIRSLPIKSAFFAPGSFMQNFHTNQGPKPLGDGTYGVFNFISPNAKIPLIDTQGDTGKYIGAYLAEPEKYEGKVFWAATELKTYPEITKIISEATGKTVVYKQIPREVFASFMPSPLMADYFTDMGEWIQDYGYFGPESQKRVDWTVKQARGKLTTLEEFLKREPLKLD